MQVEVESKLFLIESFVKLFTDLADPTQLQLVGVGVVVVSRVTRRENMRGRKEERRTTIRGNDNTCWKFGGCPVGVWRVSGNYLLGDWRVSG